MFTTSKAGGASGGTMTIPNAASTGNTTASSGAQRSLGNTIASPTGVVTTVLVLLALVLFGAVIGQREKVRNALEPHSIVINAWNMIMVGLIVFADFLLIKILLAKATAWHLPGAATLATIIHAST